jgi:Ca2+/Na+ antiporter
MSQLLIIAGIIGALLFFKWARKQPKKKQLHAILILLAVVLILMAATGRLNWLFAAIATLIALAQKYIGLLSYLPFFKKLFGSQQTQDSQDNNNVPTHSDMTTEEACKILGISTDATKEEIIDAHRKLIQKNHPDRGGNDYLATKINQAKNYLLKKFK